MACTNKIWPRLAVDRSGLVEWGYVISASLRNSYGYVISAAPPTVGRGSDVATATAAARVVMFY